MLPIEEITITAHISRIPIASVGVAKSTVLVYRPLCIIVALVVHADRIGGTI